MRNSQSWSSLCMIDCHRSSIQKLEAYLMFDGHGTVAFSPSIAWGSEYLNDRIVNRACSQLSSFISLFRSSSINLSPCFMSITSGISPFKFTHAFVEDPFFPPHAHHTIFQRALPLVFDPLDLVVSAKNGVTVLFVIITNICQTLIVGVV